MKYIFNTENAEKLIRDSGLRKGHIIKKMDATTTTFGRWMKGETHIPLVKAAELADIIDCNVSDLLIQEKSN